jgi:hypothetical protein
MSLKVRSMVVAISAACLASLCWIPVASAQSSAQPSLQFLSPETLEKSLEDGKDSLTTEVTVQNNSGQTQEVAFSVLGADHPVTVTGPSGASLAAYGSKPFTLTLGPSELGHTSTGVLLVKGQSIEPDTLSLTVKPATTYPAWLFLIVFGSLGLALVFIVVRWLTFRRDAKCTLTSRMGPVGWKFTDSWASTVTVVGALLGTIVASNALPEETTLQPKITYAGLNFLFGVVIVLAPLLYTSTAAPVQLTRRNVHGKEPQFQGYIWTFLAASCLTIWATVGELATVVGLFNEIRLANSLPLAVVVLLLVLVVVAIVLLGRYSWTSIASRIEFQYERTPRRRRHPPKRTARERDPAIAGADRGDVGALSERAEADRETPSDDDTEKHLEPVPLL